MKKYFVLKVLAMNLLSLAVTSVFAASDASVLPKQQVENIVRDYLVKNPDVIIQALQTYQQQQMDQARKSIEKTQQNSPKFANELFHNAVDPMIGNAKGKVTIVEFFDYQCSHCMDMAPVMDAAIKSNPDIKIIFKEFPIRGPVSEIAAKAALAANMQGKYFEFHKAVMATHRALTEEDLMNIAKSVGLNVNKLKEDMKSDAVSKQLKANYKLATSLQLMGTPALFIASSNVSNSSPASAIIFVPGEVDSTRLNEIIKKTSG